MRANEAWKVAKAVIDKELDNFGRLQAQNLAKVLLSVAEAAKEGKTSVLISDEYGGLTVYLKELGYKITYGPNELMNEQFRVGWYDVKPANKIYSAIKRFMERT